MNLSRLKKSLESCKIDEQVKRDEIYKRRLKKKEKHHRLILKNTEPKVVLDYLTKRSSMSSLVVSEGKLEEQLAFTLKMTQQTGETRHSCFPFLSLQTLDIRQE